MSRDFDLPGFAAHLLGMITEQAMVENDTLERAAIIIEVEAKESLGTYQSDSGPFPAWQELADATKADRVAQGYPENEPELRSGALRDSIEHTVLTHSAEIGSDEPVMEFQELGTAHMPARSILGGAAARKTDAVLEELGESIYASLIMQGGRAKLPITE